MKQNKSLWFIILGSLFSVVLLFAQDKIPDKAKVATPWDKMAAKNEIPHLLRSLSVGRAFPPSFHDTQENSIQDDAQTLLPFWAKLARMDEPVRILQIGDSHIRGHVLSYEVRLLLEHDFGADAVEPIPISYQTSGLAVETGHPGIVYHMMGVNGATAGSFQTPERMEEIARLAPDLIIFSFGTNEAHVKSYDATEHRTHLEALYDSLRRDVPQAVLLMTTPPGAYISRGSRRRRVKVPNPLTEQVVKTELAFAAAHRIAYWDLFHIAGGEKAACRNWLAIDAYQADRVHFTHEGYKLQGRLLHEAMIKAFNKYVESQLDN